ncbi:MAG: hypothetical protein IJJ33_07560 [Victivallales bacterium]|nr:hypothetical protein [Victivallales bacterium]
MKKILFYVLALVAACAYARDSTPLQISLWPPNAQVAPQNINVTGLKINLPFGGNDQIYGLDLGFASTSEECSALQVNLIINRSHTRFSGIQAGLINQAGSASGIVLGGMNITDDKFHGLEIGILNSSMETQGVQIGLINYTEFMMGIQIGLINIITQSNVPFFPFVNICF